MISLDVVNARQVLAAFSPLDQFHLAQDLSLSFQTEEQKQKWASDATGLSRFCDMPDSRQHRIFECPTAQEVRQEFSDTLQYLSEEGREFHDLPFFNSPSQPRFVSSSSP